jgi:hypothetical protein
MISLFAAVAVLSSSSSSNAVSSLRQVFHSLVVQLIAVERCSSSALNAALRQARSLSVHHSVVSFHFARRPRLLGTFTFPELPRSVGWLGFIHERSTHV